MWRSLCTAEITASSFQVVHLPNAVSFLNTLSSLTEVSITGKDDTISTVGSQALEGLQASLTSLTLNAGQDQLYTFNRTMTIDSLVCLLLPWRLSLRSLQLSNCHLTGSAGAMLGSSGFFACFSGLRVLQLSAVHATPPFRSLDLAGCTDLQDLDCFSSALSFLNLTECKALTRLQCSYNVLKTLDMSACTGLVSLECRSNMLGGALDLSCCKDLSSLDISRNKTLNFVTLSACKRLKTLVSTDNHQLSTLDLSACSELRSLNCSPGQLTALSLSDVATLDKLSCGHNRDSLVISGGLQVSDLSCDARAFQSFPQSLRRELLVLCLVNNSITEPVSGFEQLHHLSCSISSTGSVDLTGCTSVSVKCCCTTEALQILGRGAVYNLTLTGTCLAKLSGFSMLKELDLTLNNTQGVLDLSVCGKTLQKVTLSCAWGRRTVQTNIRLKGCKLLTYLNFQYLETLTQINLASCPGLLHFICVGSGMNILDVTCCPLLISLDVRNSACLKTLWINKSNKLAYSAIQSDNCPKLPDQLGQPTGMA